jgi:hypothetical protein
VVLGIVGRVETVVVVLAAVVVVARELVGDEPAVVVLSAPRLDDGGPDAVVLAGLDPAALLLVAGGLEVDPAAEGVPLDLVLGPASQPASSAAPSTPRNVRRPMAPRRPRSSIPVTQTSVLPARLIQQ